jgi:hypothetical protein
MDGSGSLLSDCLVVALSLELGSSKHRDKSGNALFQDVYPVEDQVEAPPPSETPPKRGP